MRHRTSIPRIWVHWMSLLALTGCAIAGVRHYSVENDLDSWFPQLAALGPDRAYVVVGGKSEVVDIQALSASLSAQPEIAEVYDPAGITLGSMLQTIIPGAGQGPRLDPRGFVISENGDYVGLFAFGRDGVACEQVIAAVDRSLMASDIGRDDVALGGSAVFECALNHASQDRLPAIMGVVFLVGGVMLWLVTGSWRTAIEGMAAIACSVLILFGLLSWLRQPVDMVVSIVPPLMMAVGYSYACHRALQRSVTWPLIVSMVTTAAGFAGFAFAPVEPIRRFGIIAIVGILLVLGCVLLLVAYRPVRQQGIALVRRSAVGCTAFVRRRPGLIIGGSIILTLVGTVVVPLLTSNPDPLSYFAAGSCIVLDSQELEANLTGMLPSQVVISGDCDIAGIIQLIESDPHVIKVIPAEIDAATAPGGIQQTLLWCLSKQDDLQHLAASADRWRTLVEQRGGSLQWRGVAAQLVQIDHVVRRVAAASLGGMMLIAGCFVGILARSILLGFVSVWVNVMPVLGVVIVLALFDIPVALPTFMIGAIAIGIGLDDTVHILYRWRRERQNIPRTMLRLWRPCAGSSLIAVASLAPLAASPFTPTSQFGVLLAVAIAAALATDMLLLPALLQVVHMRGANAERSCRR